MTTRSEEVIREIAGIVSASIDDAWLNAFVEAEVDSDLVNLCVWYFDQSGQEKQFHAPRKLAIRLSELRKCRDDRDDSA